MVEVVVRNNVREKREGDEKCDKGGKVERWRGTTCRLYTSNRWQRRVHPRRIFVT